MDYDPFSDQLPNYRFLFYSHDGLGLGHVRRNLAIAAGLTALHPQASVLLVTGSAEVGQLGLYPNVETLKLPSLQKVKNGEYVARRLPVSPSEILSMRSALLETAMESFRPDVLLVDKHPFGANGELRRPLERFRASGGRAVLGLRDILDEPRSVLEEWDVENWRQEVEEHFEAVLVYGQRNVFDAMTEYEFSEAMSERTRFCGYVVNDFPSPGSNAGWPRPRNSCPNGRPIVLATAGGGEDGFHVLRMFIEASRDAEWDGVVVTGPMSPGSQQDLLYQLATEAGIAFHTFVPHLDEWFAQVDAVVCMSGYNTLAEAISRAARIIAVPRSTPRTEQLIRARLFAQLGVLQLLEPSASSSEILQERIRSGLRIPKAHVSDQASSALDFQGAQRAAAFLLQMAEERSPSLSSEKLRARQNVGTAQQELTRRFQKCA